MAQQSHLHTKSVLGVCCRASSCVRVRATTGHSKELPCIYLPRRGTASSYRASTMQVVAVRAPSCIEDARQLRGKKGHALCPKGTTYTCVRCVAVPTHVPLLALSRRDRARRGTAIDTQHAPRICMWIEKMTKVRAFFGAKSLL